MTTTTGVIEPASAVARLAADLIDEAGFSEPPFHPRVLASYQDISQVREVKMTSAARLIPEDDQLIIEVNAWHTKGKQHLSIDHEISHTLLPTYTGQGVDDRHTGDFPTGAGAEEELLCDIGAAALLLDARWLRPFALEAGPSIASLLDLAGKFEASLHATAWKLAELAVWPCAFVMWEDGFRKDERVAREQLALPGLEPGGPVPKLRVKSVYATASFGVYVPRNKSVDEDSLVAMCREEGEMSVGIERFAFGREPARLYCENLHAPYTADGEVRDRVISLLLPVHGRGRTHTQRANYQHEFL